MANDCDEFNRQIYEPNLKSSQEADFDVPGRTVSTGQAELRDILAAADISIAAIIFKDQEQISI